MKQICSTSSSNICSNNSSFNDGEATVITAALVVIVAWIVAVVVEVIMELRRQLWWELVSKFEGVQTKSGTIFFIKSCFSL